MPAPLLHLGATVTCSHGGQAAPSAPTPRVLVCGQPAVPIASPYTVVGCPFAPSAGNGPCASGQWLTGTVRVLSAGQPLALMTGQSLCVPTGTPLLPVAAQTRVLVT
jgi:hypothetical protein